MAASALGGKMSSCPPAVCALPSWAGSAMRGSGSEDGDQKNPYSLGFHVPEQWHSSQRDRPGASPASVRALRQVWERSELGFAFVASPLLCGALLQSPSRLGQQLHPEVFHAGC